MTPEELKAARAELGLSQGQLGAIVGASERMVRIWERGLSPRAGQKAPIPQAVEIIVNLMVGHPRLRKVLIGCYLGNHAAVQGRPAKRKRVKAQEARRDPADDDASGNHV